MDKQKILKGILFGILGVGALAGCGSNNSAASSTDLASTTGTNATPGALNLTCNRAIQNDIEVHLMAVTDQNGNINNNLIRLKFAHVPDEYMSSGYDIQIRKWTASSTGVVAPADTDAPFYANVRFDHKSNGIYQPASNWNYNLACDTCPTLVWSNMQLIAKDNGNQTFTSANAFFDQFHLLIDLSDSTGGTTSGLNWKALEIIFMNGNVPVKYLNVLIPSFAADPTVYASTHPPVLNALHPFASQANQGFSASQFGSMANSYCF